VIVPGSSVHRARSTEQGVTILFMEGRGEAGRSISQRSSDVSPAFE
jgi:hypothetical protein